MGITWNVFARVFPVRSLADEGACFTIEVDGLQYVVTADHLVPDKVGGDSLSIHGRQGWRDYPIRSASHSGVGLDIAVFSLGEPIAPAPPCKPDSRDLDMGQEVFFLGFPDGRSVEGPGLEPMAFTKRALLSGWEKDGEGGLRHHLDGINNPGFSGGPVVFRPRGTPSAAFQIAGVVSSFRFTTVRVYDDDGRYTGTVAEVNAGLLVSNDIAHAVKLARRLADGPTPPTGPANAYSGQMRTGPGPT